MSHLTKALNANGYSLSQTNNAFHSTLHPKPKNPSSSHPLAKISIPYIQGVTNHICKSISKRNITTLFKPQITLSQLFRSTKDKNDPILGSKVYEIPCLCDMSYIGQTRRSFKAQLKEHMDDSYHKPNRQIFLR